MASSVKAFIRQKNAYAFRCGDRARMPAAGRTTGVRLHSSALLFLSFRKRRNRSIPILPAEAHNARKFLVQTRLHI